MKKNNIFLLTSAFVLLFSGCLKEDELEGNRPVTLEPMTFHAAMESGADTKTVIEGNVGDDVRYLKWLPEDKIGVYNPDTYKFEIFVNVNEEASSTAVFEGMNSVQDEYYAVYPYSESHSYDRWDKIMTLDLPSVQKYSAGSFGIDANPMVALAGNGEKFFFQNLCGVLVINITGEVSVKSLSVTLLDDSGNPAAVSGKHTVSMDYIESPTLSSTEESKKTVTLDCGEGVALNPSEPTPFHVVLPAGTYSGITVSVLTTDGGIMVKQGKNSLRIRRSRVTSAGEFRHQSEVSVDLSERGTSNCYIVSEPGVYSFDATVIGNGEFGLVPNAGFHTDNPNITPASVELLWEDRPGVVQSVYYQDGRIGFYSSGIEGNALLAAKDASGTIVWSWHIWTIDGLTDHVYVNESGTFNVMDRNLGALSNSRGEGDQWKLSVGTYYQWGRKDPLIESHYIVVHNNVSIKESIAAPSTFFYNINISNWTQDNEELWSPERKTVYDPCPVGYKIATHDIWTGFSVSGNNDKGLYFIYDGNGQMSWYPSSSWIDTGGRLINHDYESYIWAAEYKENLHFSSNSLDLTSKYQPSNGFNVRCIKDEGYVDVSYPQVQISGFEEITSSSTKVVVEILSEGISEITEKGIIWGTMPDLSDGIRVDGGSGNDDFTIDLTGLEKSTRYYVKPYAVNTRGESFGLVKSFATKYSDNETDLSVYGTSNCYIVTYAGTHSFDCTVKGNSQESVGVPSSVEVLWETDNTSTAISVGDIIHDARLIENSRVTFEATGTPGNALIAVKDASGVILWSWHIWSTDYDPEETAQTYQSGAVMMDRNLGALNVKKGDVLSWGLFYQQGRKDPFVGCGDIAARTFAATAPSNVIEFSSGGGDDFVIHNPCKVTNGYNVVWTDEKNQNDPCPPGWKVPSASAYECFSDGGGVTSSSSMIFSYPLSSPDAYFPLTGDTEMGQQNLRSPGTTSYMWTSHMGYAYSIHNGYETSRSQYDENPVRCMKE